MDKTVLIATTNQGKAAEISQLLSSAFPHTQFFSLTDLAAQGKSIPEAPESGDNFEAISSAKAGYYAAHAQMATIAEDSGLLIDILDGRPGIYSARYASTDQKRIQKVIKMMENVPESQRSAHFVCVVAYCQYPSQKTMSFRGRVDGKITLKPIGRYGFGYDPIFYYPPLKKTFAQISANQKNKLSHRYKAFHQLILHFSNHSNDSN